MAFTHKPEARLPLGPHFRGASVTTLQVSLHATDRSFARPPRVGTLSFRFDAGISPHAGNQLPGTLASPQAGLTPAGCPELVVRLHHDLQSFTVPELLDTRVIQKSMINCCSPSACLHRRQRFSRENLRVPIQEFSPPGRTVALPSYYRVDGLADAGARSAGSRQPARSVE